MTALLAFLAFAALAAGFAVWPVLGAKGKTRKARWAMAAALGLAVLGIGVGLYLAIGRPDLAMRTQREALQGRDVRALVAMLAQKIRDTPDDPKGFVFLGRGYLTLGEPAMAAKAFARALTLEQRAKKTDPGLYSAYGEALTRAASGAVTPDAENAFRSALTLDPHDKAARYYLGLASVARGRPSEAITLWQSLLADLPSGALRSELVDRIDILKVQAEGGTPDISAMVERLAERLKVEPKDADGWRRLVRAYAVLGETEKAKAALREGRKALAQDPQGLAALNAQADASNLGK